MTAGTPRNTNAGGSGASGWGPSEPVALWFLQVVVTSFWSLALLVIFFGGESPDPTPIWLLAASSLSIWLVYVLGPILVTRTRGAGPVADLWAAITGRDIPIGLVIGVALQLVVLPIVYWPVLQLTDNDPSEAAEELVDLIDGPIDLLLLAFVVAVGAPLAEEFFYRGLLLQGLRRRVPDAVAILVSSALFALVHIQPILYLGTFVLGVAAAVVTLRTGRLGIAWSMHVGFNGATLVLLLA